MLKPESKQAVSNFFAAAETEFNAFLKARSPEEYEAAAQLILDSQAKGGRLHVTGIGKCSHVSTYAASLFSSTGNPAYYLHGTEAVHGSCGQLAAGDVVIAISNSGETAELKAPCWLSRTTAARSSASPATRTAGLPSTPMPSSSPASRRRAAP